MFRHRGKSRTLAHNLKLASLLSFVAGIVNVTGFFSLQQLTTNVTGHFAFFADEVIKRNFQQALIFLFYIVAFFIGAFISGTIIGFIERRNSRYVNIVPMLAEITILISVALLDPATVIQHVNLIACGLLFAMGLQNALVTSISNAVVRTTHLTGLFTDLGIELSQLLYFRKAEQQQKLRSSVKLRAAIISFFFLGCVAGGSTYLQFGIRSLLLGAGCLVIGLFYDVIRFRVLLLKRKIR